MKNLCSTQYRQTIKWKILELKIMGQGNMFKIYLGGFLKEGSTVQIIEERKYTERKLLRNFHNLTLEPELTSLNNCAVCNQKQHRLTFKKFSSHEKERLDNGIRQKQTSVSAFILMFIDSGLDTIVKKLYVKSSNVMVHSKCLWKPKEG